MLRTIILSLATIALLSSTANARRAETVREPAPIITGAKRWSSDYREPIAINQRSEEEAVVEKKSTPAPVVKPQKPAATTVEKSEKAKASGLLISLGSVFSSSDAKKKETSEVVTAPVTKAEPAPESTPSKTKTNFGAQETAVETTTLNSVTTSEPVQKKAQPAPRKVTQATATAKVATAENQAATNDESAKKVAVATVTTAAVAAAPKKEEAPAAKAVTETAAEEPATKTNFSASSAQQSGRKPQWSEDGTKASDIGKGIVAGTAAVGSAVSSTIKKAKPEGEPAEVHPKRRAGTTSGTNFSTSEKTDSGRKPQWSEDGTKISDIGKGIVAGTAAVGGAVGGAVSATVKKVKPTGTPTQAHPKRTNGANRGMTFYPGELPPEPVVVAKPVVKKVVAKPQPKPVVKPKPAPKPAAKAAPKAVVAAKPMKPLKTYKPLPQAFTAIAYKIDESWGNTGRGMTMRQQTLLSIDHKGVWSVQTTRTDLATNKATVFNDQVNLDLRTLQKLQNTFKKSDFKNKRDISSAGSSYVSSKATLTITTATDSHTINWNGHAVVSTDEVSPNIYKLPPVKALFYLLDRTIPRN